MAPSQLVGSLDHTCIFSSFALLQGRSADSQQPRLALGSSAEQRGGPAEASKRPPQTSALLTSIEEFDTHLDFTQPPGLHRNYGNGQERPLLRGWVHFLALLVLEAVLASGVLPVHTQMLLRASSMGLYGSCIFHMLPWASMQVRSNRICFVLLYACRMSLTTHCLLNAGVPSGSSG